MLDLFAILLIGFWLDNILTIFHFASLDLFVILLILNWVVTYSDQFYLFEFLQCSCTLMGL